MGLLRILETSLFVGFLGVQCWSRRHWCGGGAWLLRQNKAEGDRRLLEEFSVHAAHVMLEAMSVVLAVMMCVLLSGSSSVGQSSVDSILNVCTVLYPLALAGRHDGLLRITRTRIHASYLMANFVLISVHLSTPADAILYCGQSLRTLYRFFSGFAVDFELSAAMNLAWSISLIRQHGSGPPELQGFTWAEFTAFEVLNFIGLQAFIYIVQDFLRSHVHLNTSMLMATNLQQAVRRLLAVLCDAELHLSPDLQLLDPSPKVSQLLAPGGSAEGASFLDFVAEQDRPRFQRFLACAGQQAPASLPLMIVDRTGYSFPADIFLARLFDLEGMPGGYILGVKDRSVNREANLAAQPQGETFGPGCPPLPLPPLPPVEATPPANEEEARGGVVEAAPESSVGHTSIAGLDLPELQVKITFDPVDPEMPIRELCCTFQAGEGLEPPTLMRWFHQSSRKRVRDWVQENCNSYAVGSDSRTAFRGAAVLQLPPPNDPTLLEAAELRINFVEEQRQPTDTNNFVEEDDEESSPEGSSGDGSLDDDEQFLAVLRMNSLRQLLLRR